MSSIEIESNLNEMSDLVTENNEIGYPVSIYFIDLAKMYMNQIRWQWHPEIEVVIINHGEALFLTDDKQIRLKAGQGMLINQNTMHAIYPADNTPNCSMYSLVFHPSFLFGFGNTVMASKFLTPILSSPIFKTMLLDEDDPLQEKLLDTINSVIAVNLAKKYGYELVTKSHLCQFWLLLLEHFVPQNVQSTKQTSLSLDEARVKDAILYMEKHYAEHITLEDLADSIHISKSECCRCFKRTLQVTPIEYLMKYRIFKAANKIQSNDPVSHSISQLAFSVGFNNASYFNKVFKQYLNCTPSEYKKNIKKDPTINQLMNISI
ncbi:MAG: helix-turn-helix transcriptional regulator [Lachnospiraceae bacterium]|nr:helix-turn-helix transcriptional regulator [Lachnospiraceae bacterium]